jgi:hypothetical protein
VVAAGQRGQDIAAPQLAAISPPRPATPAQCQTRLRTDTRREGTAARLSATYCFCPARTAAATEMTWPWTYGDKLLETRKIIPGKAEDK